MLHRTPHYAGRGGTTGTETGLQDGTHKTQPPADHLDNYSTAREHAAQDTTLQYSTAHYSIVQYTVAPLQHSGVFLDTLR